MITFRITADVKDDRRVVVTLPPEVPTGHAELLVSVASPVAEEKPAHLADWVEVQTEPGAVKQYPLRGSVLHYDNPTEPVADGDWEATR